MPTVFRLDSSIRREGSVSRAVADTLENALVGDLHGATVIRREVGLAPIAADVWAAGAFAGFVPEEQWTDEQRAARAVAAELTDEIFAADVAIFAVPLYNFGVSQHAKTWFDVVITDPRLGAHTTTPLKGRKALLVIARGGGYGPGTPREGWDHATDWLLRILRDVWGMDVEVIDTELTLADVNPAMAPLREQAAANLEASHGAAGETGKRLAVALAS
jgi:FMN-dependent NADH-azoreductase